MNYCWIYFVVFDIVWLLQAGEVFSAGDAGEADDAGEAGEVFTYTPICLHHFDILIFIF